VTGDAKDAPFEQPAPFGVVAIPLAKMRAIAAELCRKRCIIIQQKRHTPRCRDGHESIRGTRNFVFCRILQAQLQAGDIAGIKRSSQGIAKTKGIKPLRRDEIEPAGSVRHDERQSFG
jgi:hypothetical protein